MKSTCRTKTISSIVSKLGNGGIVLTHKLQRDEGQWNTQQKGFLIDSILRQYPVNPTYAVEDNGVYAVIDGVQRLSTLRDYINDKFALPANLLPVMINGEEKDISKKKYTKLDEAIQGALLDAEIQIYEISDYTDEDVREMFRRQNSGKPLNPKQLRVVYGSNEFNAKVSQLANNKFISMISSKAQKKNGSTRDWIIQTLMLIATNQENDFTSFRSKDMNNFVAEHGDEYIEKMNTLEEALNRMKNAFETIDDLPATSIPMVLYSAYRITRDKKSFSRFVDIVIDFIEHYDENEEYKLFVQNGTSNPENVSARYNYWKNLIKDL